MAEISTPPPLPAGVIRHAVWLYLRFTLSYRDVEELLARARMEITNETVRCWVLKFGPVIVRRLRRRPPPPSSGISMRWSSRSPAGECTCGGRSTTRARSSNGGSESTRDSAGAADSKAAQAAGLRTKVLVTDKLRS